jgi:hypothetical protein
MNPMQKIEGLLFTLFIGSTIGGAVWAAHPWPIRASIGIIVLGSLGVMLAVWQFVLDWQRKNGLLARSQLEAPSVQGKTEWGNIEIWSWIIGFYLLIVLVGFPLAAPLFVFGYSKFYGARWPLAIGLSALAWSFVYGIFEKILHVPWPVPLLQFLA